MKLFWIKEKKFSAWSNQSSIHVQPILEVQRNLILATNFDLLILMSLQPKVLDLSLKLRILIHQISLKYTRVKPSGWKDEKIWVCGKEWIHLTWFVYLILYIYDFIYRKWTEIQIFTLQFMPNYKYTITNKVAKI